MPAVKNWTDAELVQIVWDFRLAAGACTIGDLRKATGMAKSALHYRIQKLIADGLLLQSETVGSMRAADERMFRELADGKIIDPTKVKRRRAKAGSSA